MANIQALLQSRKFWPFYVRANEDKLSDNILSYFDKNKNDDVNKEITISIPCHHNYSLEINIIPDMRMTNLGLRNSISNTCSEMGWWDDARWHPFALQWEELLKLSGTWKNIDIHPSAAFLLLAIFVGHGIDECSLLPKREAIIREHYNQLKNYSDEEIAELAKHTIIRPTEEDYNWTKDTEFGLVFSGEYPCYSIRNREHANGAEGSFPFSEWSEIMADLK